MEQTNGKSLIEWFPEVFVGVENGMLSFIKNNYSEFIKQVNSRHDVIEPVKNRMISFYKEHCVEQKKAVEYIIDKYPDLKPISDMWNKGVMSINLSSIGFK